MNPEAELISSVCKNKDINVILSSGMDNLFRSHADVWLGLKSYYSKYRSVPDVSILQQRFGHFDPVDTNSPTEYYLDKLKDDYLDSKLKDMLISSSKELRDQSPTKVLNDIQGVLNELSKYSNAVRDLNLVDVKDAQDHYEALRTRSEEMGGIPGIRTGFDVMDAAYPTGFAPGHLAIMLGYSARGKSWLAAYFAIQAWLQGYRPMIVSLEMTPEAMRDRIYAMMASGVFRMDDFQRGSIDTDDFRTWAQKMLEDKQDFIIVSNDGVGEVNPDTIQGKIDQHKPDMVILDYLQLMNDSRRSNSETERIRNISRELKLSAVKNNIPIIAISAVTMTDVTETNSPPLLEQVSYSKAIQYDADLALSVHRYDDTDIIEVVSRKNRFGTEFIFWLEVDLSRGVIKQSLEPYSN